LPLADQCGCHLPIRPATTNFVITLHFDRSMNPPFFRSVADQCDGSPPAERADQRPLDGNLLANDTYVTPPIIFSLGMDGTNQLVVSGAQATNGGLFGHDNFTFFVVDATPPPPTY